MRDFLLFLALALSLSSVVLYTQSNSTFGAALNVSTVATSTFPDGINLTKGCFTIAGGNCISRTVIFSNSSQISGQSTTTATIPANTLTGAKKVLIRFSGVGSGGGGTASVQLKIGSGSATTTVITGTANSSTMGTVDLIPNGASAQVTVANKGGTYTRGTLALDSTAAIYVACIGIPTDGSALVDECLVELVN